MPDAAKRFYGPAQPTYPAATIFTVPASTQYIIRYIRIVNVFSGMAALTLSIGADAQSSNKFLNNHGVPSYEAWDWSGNVIMAAGDFMQAAVWPTAYLTLTVCGVEVT